MNFGKRPKIKSILRWVAVLVSSKLATNFSNHQHKNKENKKTLSIFCSHPISSTKIKTNTKVIQIKTYAFKGI
jgi:hypothetical protein